MRHLHEVVLSHVLVNQRTSNIEQKMVEIVGAHRAFPMAMTRVSVKGATHLLLPKFMSQWIYMHHCIENNVLLMDSNLSAHDYLRSRKNLPKKWTCSDPLTLICLRAMICNPPSLMR